MCEKSYFSLSSCLSCWFSSRKRSRSPRTACSTRRLWAIIAAMTVNSVVSVVLDTSVNRSPALRPPSRTGMTRNLPRSDVFGISPLSDRSSSVQFDTPSSNASHFSFELNASSTRNSAAVNPALADRRIERSVSATRRNVRVDTPFSTIASKIVLGLNWRSRPSAISWAICRTAIIE